MTLASVDWTAVAALLTAISGTAFAVSAQIRSTRANKIKREADNAMNTASGVSIGLTYLNTALEEYRHQQEEDRRRIAKLEGDVADCHKERDELRRALRDANGGR